MKVDLILYCEDPTFGVRGSRKFWAASYQTNPRFAGGFTKDPSCSVATRWGRIPEGREINIEWLHGQQHKSVACANEEAAFKFMDKKAAEKQAKGYRVALHIVDDVNVGNLYGSAADSRGFIKMATRDGTA